MIHSKVVNRRHEQIMKYIAIAEIAFMIGIAFGAGIASAPEPYEAIDVTMTLGNVDSGTITGTYVDLDGNLIVFEGVPTAPPGANGIIADFRFPALTSSRSVLWDCLRTQGSASQERLVLLLDSAEVSATAQPACESGNSETGTLPANATWTSADGYVYIRYAVLSPIGSPTILTQFDLLAGPGTVGSVSTPIVWLVVIVFVITVPFILLFIKRYGGRRR